MNGTTLNQIIKLVNVSLVTSSLPIFNIQVARYDQRHVIWLPWLLGPHDWWVQSPVQRPRWPRWLHLFQCGKWLNILMHSCVLIYWNWLCLKKYTPAAYLCKFASANVICRYIQAISLQICVYFQILFSRTMPWTTGRAREPQLRSWLLVFLHMATHSLLRTLLTTALMHLFLVLEVLESTHKRPENLPTLR